MRSRDTDFDSGSSSIGSADNEFQSVEFDPSSSDVQDTAGDSSAYRNASGLSSLKSIGSKEICNSVPQEPQNQVPFAQLFRFSTKREKSLLAAASVAALMNGSLLPLFTIIFGGVINTFSSIDRSEFSVRTITGEILSVSKFFGILGAISFFLSYIQVLFFVCTAQWQCTRIRRKYFQALMTQEMAWYDENDTGKLTARVASNMDLIYAGVGDKVGTFLQFFGMFISGFVTAFVYSWKMTLVILSVTPLLVLAAYLLSNSISKSAAESEASYGAAGAIANEVLRSIRTVTAYGAQEEESRRYYVNLDTAYKAGVRKGHMKGLSIGFMMFVVICLYALSLWYGSRLVQREGLQVGNVVIVFFSVVIGAISLGQAAPNLESFAAARGAAAPIFHVIDRKGAIDPLSNEGCVLDHVKGNLEFKNVSFAYSNRPGRMVLDGMSFRVKNGTSCALVGPSGCGKSTTVGLIERFYDPQAGSVLLDGVDIRNLNVQWLRSQIGYVSQSPSVFGMSVEENIALGAPLEPYTDPVSGKCYLRRQHVSKERIVEAAKLALAHKFIMKLPAGYSTILGNGSSQLSGGQKQRLAIARALVRNPRILLLDEATSALDAASERLVQEALERAQRGRTTIIVAHRLSTVKDADMIAVVYRGRIVERGTHAALIRRPNGAYRRLTALQNIENETTLQENRDGDGIGYDDLNSKSNFWSSAPRRSSLFSFRSGRRSTGFSSMFETLGFDTEDEGRSATDTGVFRRALSDNKEEFPLMFVGALGATGAGASWPLVALLFANVLDELSKPEEPDITRIVFFTRMFVVLAAGTFLSNYLLFAMTGISGERLTRRLRMVSFKSILRQEMGFFDKEENQTGALTAGLASNASLVKGLSGEVFGAVVQAVAAIVTGFSVAFSQCWRVALSVLAVTPGVILGQILQIKLMSGFDCDSRERYAESCAIATEALCNIRTVAALGAQDDFCGLYERKLVIPMQNGRKGAHISGIAYGFSQLSSFLIFLIAFYSGSRFIDAGHCDFQGLLRAMFGLLYCAISFGNVSMCMPDLAASRIAATKIYRLIDRESTIDPCSEIGKEMRICDGKVDLRSVEFAYPRRPNVRVLHGLSFSVASNKTVALVGESGCGKSTVVAMVERFYDPRSGEVRIDGKNLVDVNMHSARSHIGLVSQEPELFNRSVRDNIAYGFLRDEGTIVTDAQVTEAAKVANAHNFILNLPDGYDTLCGEEGSQLSGGQRQRIAIARSLVRQPRILILDEATSALDAKSEQIVQEALERARSGRTTIVIAHRLSTVRNADEICVIADGTIVERGTHRELMERAGPYAKLIKNQVDLAAENR